MADSTTYSERPPGPGPHMNADTLVDLVLGLLPADERESVLTHIEHCPACEEQFQQTVAECEQTRAQWGLMGAGVQPGAEAEGARSAWVRLAGRLGANSLVEVLASAGSALSGCLRLPTVRWATAAVAAGVLVILLLPSQVTDRVDTPQLAWLPDCAGLIQHRSAQQATAHPEAQLPDSRLVEGLAAYAARDLAKAVDLLAGAEAEGYEESLRRLYLGSALTQCGRYQEAAECLEGLALETFPEEWGIEGQWTLYVAYRDAGNTQRADSLLRRFGEQPGEIGRRAAQMLGRASRK